MGILDALRNIPKQYMETKEVSSIIVSSAKAWFIVNRINNYRPITVRLDIPVGCSLSVCDIEESGKRFLPELRFGETAEQQFVEKEIKCAIITFEDGTEEFRDLSFCDQDLPLNISLEKELCKTQYLKENVYGKIVNYQKVKELHYKGLDFVPQWTPVNEQKLLDLFSEENIQNIHTTPSDNGLDVVLTLDDGQQKVFPLDYQSRPLGVGEDISAKECYIVTKRKYHTKHINLILVK